MNEQSTRNGQNHSISSISILCCCSRNTTIPRHSLHNKTIQTLKTKDNWWQKTLEKDYGVILCRYEYQASLFANTWNYDVKSHKIVYLIKNNSILWDFFVHFSQLGFVSTKKNQHKNWTFAAGEVSEHYVLIYQLLLLHSQTWLGSTFSKGNSENDSVNLKAFLFFSLLSHTKEEDQIVHFNED